MYRNTYLELYKTAVSVEQTPTVLLSHFTQIYNTLGCVLQDLQFQMGRIILQNSKFGQQEPKIGFCQQRKKQQKNNPTQKSVLKMEEFQKSHLPRQSQQSRNKNLTKCERVAKEGQELSHQIQSIKGNSKRIDKKEQCYINVSPQMEIVRNNQNSVKQGSDSFDSLFDSKRPQRKELSNKFHGFSPIQQMDLQQVRQPPAEAENTYDDFLDRIFKDAESRKSR